ncbi:MAG: hypothetical protein ACLU4N_02495 [Butyricimonas faecihominis]
MTDESKMPLPGVTVVVKIPGAASSSIGTATNDMGEYEVSWIAQKDVALSFFIRDGDSGCEVHEPEGD